MAASACSLPVKVGVRGPHAKSRRWRCCMPGSDFLLGRRLAVGERVRLEELTVPFDELSKRIAGYGGLFRFMEARSRGLETERPIDTPPRPMTIVEKILARHMKTVHATVKPGDS